MAIETVNDIVDQQRGGAVDGSDKFVFLTVTAVASALLNSCDEVINKAMLIKLKRAVVENSPPLLEEEYGTGDLVEASLATKECVTRYLLKCFKKPRLRHVFGRIDCSAGWWHHDLLKPEFIDELANAVPDPFVERGTPAVPAAASDKVDPSGQAIRKHKLKTKKNILDPIIKAAKASAVDPDDYQSVWAEMVDLACSDNPPAPLLSYFHSSGIKYRGDKKVEHFNKSALKKRMDPDAR